jgi:DUF4097 and DUF4098 domain-containing protein YvlB
MKRRFCILSILTLALAFPAAATGINSSIRVESGEVVEDDLSTLNGQIRIDDRATVNGEAESVNGSVEVGRDVQIESVSTVNGDVEIGEGTVVDGEVETVNGSISMKAGSRARSVGTVNGSMELSGADVEKGLQTYNGDVTLREGTMVGGDIRISQSSGHSDRHGRALRIYIEDGSSVAGGVIVEDEEMEVEVYLRGGSVAGQIQGATVVEK